MTFAIIWEYVHSASSFIKIKTVLFHGPKHAQSKNRSCYQKLSLATKLQFYLPCKRAVEVLELFHSRICSLLSITVLYLILLINYRQISRHNLNFEILCVVWWPVVLIEIYHVKLKIESEKNEI